LNSLLFDEKFFTETKEIPSVQQYNEGFSNYVTAAGSLKKAVKFNFGQFPMTASELLTSQHLREY